MQLVLFFMLILTVSLALLLFATRPSQDARRLMVRITDIRDPRRRAAGAAADAALPQPAGRWTYGDAGARLETLLRQRGLAPGLAGVDRLLLEAGSSTSAGPLLMQSVTIGLLSAAAGLVLRWPLLFLAGGVGGMLLPAGRLLFQRRQRLQTVTAELPDTADLMARALRAGHSMTQTIELLGEKGPPLLGAEFARVFQQQKLGVTLRDVLIEMGRRLPSRDLQFLITAVLVQRETGGDLATVLDRTAYVLRERIQLQAQVQVHTAQGRLTGWILSLMPVVLLAAMLLFSPAYARSLFDDPMGRRLLYAGAGLIVTGSLIIRRIVGVPV